MKQNNYPPFHPNPYGPDWPDANFHPDWPHYRHMHHWNDTEPAAVVPWPEECCPQPSDDCMCVTSGDIQMWNTISAVSAFAKIDVDGLSGLSALSGISKLIPMAEAVDAYSGIWMSAGYVPNIYEDIYELSARVDTKAPLSGEYLQQVYSDPYFFDGKGTEKSTLKPSRDLENTMIMVSACTDNFTKALVNTDMCDVVKEDIKALEERTAANQWAIQTLSNRIDHMGGGGGKSTDWTNSAVSLEESKKHSDVFYYYDSTKVNIK